MARKLTVEIVGDASSLEREFKRSAQGAKRFEQQMGRAGGRGSSMFHAVGKQVGGFLGPAATATGAAALLGAGLKTAVSAASDLNEEVSKSKQIFGAGAGAVRAWAKDAPEALKTSQAEALAAASGFGSMLETAGLAQDKAADMSIAMTRLGADMASFNNEDPTEMLDRLRSGLAGEAEPLRRFGVLLSEARVAQEAHRMGLVHGTQKLSEQQKVLARYSILMRDTVKQQGDVARTGGQFAGQQRELAARLKETAAAIGAELLPKVVDVTKKINDWLGDPANKRRVLDAFGNSVDDVTGSVKDLSSAIDSIHDVSATIRVKFHVGGASGWVPGGFGGNEPSLALDKRIWDAIHGDFSGLLNQSRSGGRRRPPTLSGGVPGRLSTFLTPERGAGLRTDAFDRRGVGAMPTGGGGGGAPAYVPTAAQRNRWFDSLVSRRLDRVQDVRTLRGQVSALTAIAGLIRERLAKAKDVTRRLTLEDELVSIYRDRSGLNAQILSNKNERERLRLLDEAEKLAAKRARSLERLRAAQSSARAAFGELGQGPIMAGPMIDALRQWGGKATARDFIADLRKQVADFTTLQRDLGTLRKRGVSQFAIQTLWAQGQGGAEEAHALAGASRGQVASFNRLIGQRRNLVQQAARMNVRSATINIAAANVTMRGPSRKTSQADNRAGARGTGKI